MAAQEQESAEARARRIVADWPVPTDSQLGALRLLLACARPPMGDIAELDTHRRHRYRAAS